MNEFSVYSFGNCHLMGFIYIFSSFFVTERLLLTEKINFTMMAGGSAEHDYGSGPSYGSSTRSGSWFLCVDTEIGCRFYNRNNSFLMMCSINKLFI